MTLVQFIKSPIKSTKKLIAERRRKELLTQKLAEVLEHSFYDEHTNTLVLKSPTNLVISTSGSQMNVCHSGYKIDIADKIHLNPILSKQTRININKLDCNFSDVITTFERAYYNEELRV